MLEKPIETYLRTQWTHRTRGECQKLPPIFCKGLPDQMCMCWPGWVIFVELKASDGGEVSKAQQVLHDRWRKRGHWVEVLYTKEMIDKFIDKICALIILQTPTKTKD